MKQTIAIIDQHLAHCEKMLEKQSSHVLTQYYAERYTYPKELLLQIKKSLIQETKQKNAS